MSAVAKFMIGAIVTSLMALAAHNWLDTGSRFIDQLQSSGETALGNASGSGTRIIFEREPSLRRIAILSGTADDATRKRLLTVVRAVPGVADARWAGDLPTNGAAADGRPEKQ